MRVIGKCKKKKGKRRKKHKFKKKRKERWAENVIKKKISKSKRKLMMDGESEINGKDIQEGRKEKEKEMKKRTKKKKERTNRKKESNEEIWRRGMIERKRKDVRKWK